MSDLTRRDKFGRMGIGPVQGLISPDYPLLKPSSDVRHLIAEIRVVLGPGWESTSGYYGHFANPVLPLRISWLYGFGAGPSTAPPSRVPRLAKEIEITAGNGAKLVDTASTNTTVHDFQETTINNRLSSASWAFSTTGVYTPGSVQSAFSGRIYVIYHTAWNFEETPTPVEYPISFEPVSAELLTKSVVLDDFVQGFSLQPVAEGHNVELVVKQNGTNPTVTVNAVGGAGQGVAPCTYWTRPAETVDAVYSINGVRPNEHGNLVLSTKDDCWYTSVRSAVATGFDSVFDTGTTIDQMQDSRVTVMRVGQTCSPCPDCDDYNDLIDRMNAAVVKYNALASKFPGMRDTLKQQIDAWNSTSETNKRSRLQLTMTPQACPQFEIGISYTNFSRLPKRNVVIDLTLSAVTGTLLDSLVTLRPHGAYSAEPENNRVLTELWPSVRLIFNEVKPFRSEFAVLNVLHGRTGNIANGIIDPTSHVSTGMTIKVVAALTVDGRAKRAGTDWTIENSVVLDCSYASSNTYSVF